MSKCVDNLILLLPGGGESALNLVLAHPRISALFYRILLTFTDLSVVSLLLYDGDGFFQLVQRNGVRAGFSQFPFIINATDGGVEILGFAGIA